MLFGGPGTGKTELVRQLARKSKRNLFSLNLSQIRDKYVGESEKKIMSAFNHYNYVLNYSSGLSPILLFNEADAILGNRLKTRSSIDKMENSLQNIILDFIERFEGILICTTNLTGNLDKAFERRFLFKKKIDSPDVSTRTRIISNKLNQIPIRTAKKLALLYPVTGGEVANVSKRILIQECIHGKMDWNEIEVFFKNECNGFQVNTPQSKIGF